MNAFAHPERPDTHVVVDVGACPQMFRMLTEMTCGSGHAQYESSLGGFVMALSPGWGPAAPRRRPTYQWLRERLGRATSLTRPACAACPACPPLDLLADASPPPAPTEPSPLPPPSEPAPPLTRSVHSQTEEPSPVAVPLQTSTETQTDAEEEVRSAGTAEAPPLPPPEPPAPPAWLREDASTTAPSLRKRSCSPSEEVRRPPRPPPPEDDMVSGARTPPPAGRPGQPPPTFRSYTGGACTCSISCRGTESAAGGGRRRG